MQRVLEYVMSADEHGTVANIVGSEKRNAELMADKLTKEDIPKGQLIDFLYNVSVQLEIAENILKSY